MYKTFGFYTCKSEWRLSAWYFVRSAHAWLHDLDIVLECIYTRSH